MTTAFRFEYGPSFRRQIDKLDGTWVNVTFAREEKYNPFTERDMEIIHRALQMLYIKNKGFSDLLSRKGFSLSVVNNFHVSGGDMFPHINFKLHNFFEGESQDDRCFHAYFDHNGYICSVTYITNVLSL